MDTLQTALAEFHQNPSSLVIRCSHPVVSKYILLSSGVKDTLLSMLQQRDSTIHNDAYDIVFHLISFEERNALIFVLASPSLLNVLEANLETLSQLSYLNSADSRVEFEKIINIWEKLTLIKHDQIQMHLHSRNSKSIVQILRKLILIDTGGKWLDLTLRMLSFLRPLNSSLVSLLIDRYILKPVLASKQRNFHPAACLSIIQYLTAKSKLPRSPNEHHFLEPFIKDLQRMATQIRSRYLEVSDKRIYFNVPFDLKRIVTGIESLVNLYMSADKNASALVVLMHQMLIDDMNRKPEVFQTLIQCHSNMKAKTRSPSWTKEYSFSENDHASFLFYAFSFFGKYISVMQKDHAEHIIQSLTQILFTVCKLVDVFQDRSRIALVHQLIMVWIPVISHHPSSWKWIPQCISITCTSLNQSVSLLPDIRNGDKSVETNLEKSNLIQSQYLHEIFKAAQSHIEKSLESQKLPPRCQSAQLQRSDDMLYRPQKSLIGHENEQLLETKIKLFIANDFMNLMTELQRVVIRVDVEMQSVIKPFIQFMSDILRQNVVQSQTQMTAIVHRGRRLKPLGLDTSIGKPQDRIVSMAL